MRKILPVTLAATALIAPAFAVLAKPPSPAQGAQTFRECAACHNAQPGALGPSLDGVVGRTAGAVPGFRYSAPLKRSGVIWTPEKLQAFLVDPQTVIPGNRMPFSGVPADEAADVVAYLRTLPAK